MLFRLDKLFCILDITELVDSNYMSVFIYILLINNIVNFAFAVVYFARLPLPVADGKIRILEGIETVFCVYFFFR